MNSYQFVCTKDHPWAQDTRAATIVHPDSILEREEYDWGADHEDYEVRLCPHCGTRFRVGIPT